jgi:uncharacterized protein YndB with AHSA1/START domain
VSGPFGTVRLRRLLDATVERVFRAFTDPAEAVQWWGPAGIRTSEVEIDLRVGGRCRWVMHPGDGVAVLHGEIVDLDPPRLLVMTNRWEGNPVESLVTIRLTPVGDRTVLDLVHERLPRTVDPREYEQGWGAALKSLTAHLRKGVAVTTPNTARVARSYFDAWTGRKGPDALREFLAEDFTFDAGAHRIEGREPFLAGGGWPEHADTTMLAEAYDGEHAFQLYSASHGGTQIKIVEHLTVRDDRIVASEIVVDGAAFAAFMAR